MHGPTQAAIGRPWLSRLQRVQYNSCKERLDEDRNESATRLTLRGHGDGGSRAQGLNISGQLRPRSWVIFAGSGGTPVMKCNPYKMTSVKRDPLRYYCWSSSFKVEFKKPCGVDRVCGLGNFKSKYRVQVSKYGTRSFGLPTGSPRQL